MPLTPSTEDLKQFSTVAECVRNEKSARELAEKLALAGAHDYSDLVAATARLVLDRGIYLSDRAAADLMQISYSGLRLRRKKGQFPRADRLSEARIAMNRFTLLAYSMQLLAFNDLERLRKGAAA